MTSGHELRPDPEATRAVIQALYGSDPEREWQRLDRHRTEFAVTLRALSEHLPPPPARILDCGGGPGRYAIWLAQKGYEVTLFDLSPDLLALAREHASAAGVTLSGFEEGTAVDLSRFAEDAFDAVLLMGPLYHLLGADERRQALAEAYRVVKPGGPVFAAFIARYAAHIDAAIKYPEEPVRQPGIYARIEATGQLSPRAHGNAGFVAYFAHPTEVAPLCKRAGLDVETILGVEGVCSLREEQVNRLEGAAWERWVDLNYRIAHDPCIHGGVEHLLAVCHKPVWRSVLKTLAARLNAADIDYRLVGSAALALHGVDVPVHDLDLAMMSRADAERFHAHFAEHALLPVAWRESAEIRSYFGRYEIDSVTVEVMAAFERRSASSDGKGDRWLPGNRWLPSLNATRAVRDLDGTPVTVLTLEEELLAQLRRGRLNKVAAALPLCDADRLLARLRAAQKIGWL